MTQRTIVLFCAAIGVLLALLSTAMSIAQAVGTTPAVFFMDNRRWASLRTAGGLPVEFFGVIWFSAVLLVARRSKPLTALRVRAVFVSALPLAGSGIWLSSTTLYCYPIALCTALIGVIIVTVSSANDAWEATGGSTRPTSTVSRILAQPKLLLKLAAFASVTSAVGSSLHVWALSVPPDVAQDRDLRRWYSAQHGIDDVGLKSASTVTVVAFTDYFCPACREFVPAYARLISSYRARGLSVELIVRDFPLDADCNATGWYPHPGACEAAYAVRLVSDTDGLTAGLRVSRWLYSRDEDEQRDAAIGYLHAQHLDRLFAERRQSLRDQVLSDTALGRRLNVTATPTYFVNGVKLPSGQSVLARVLEFEAERILGAGARALSR